MNKAIFLTNELILSDSRDGVSKINWIETGPRGGIEDVHKFVGATCLGYRHFPQYVRKFRMEISI